MKQMIKSLDPVVTLKVFVDASGRPQKVQIISGVEGSFGFNEESEKAALASKFQAGSKDGRPTPGWVTITYKYPRAR
jgi:TonB family protein